MLTDQQAMEIVKAHVEGQFPRRCTCCGREYATLTEWVEVTAPVGDPISYDAEHEEWRPAEEDGTMALSNCPCGSTLALSSKGIGIVNMWRLLFWARDRSKQRGISVSELLGWLRGEIDRQVLAERQP